MVSDFFHAKLLEDAFDDGFHKLAERLIQAGHRHARLRRHEPAQFGVHSAERVTKSHFGRLLGNSFYDTESILRVAHRHADGKSLDFHSSCYFILEYTVGGEKSKMGMKQRSQIAQIKQ
ncbi:MAG TPA: hypothetical protein VGY56_04840 [Verrucomicrobiae bacterium]|nr:hypothetical protein [Verrucomicrobiae bacterium]